MRIHISGEKAIIEAFAQAIQTDGGSVEKIGEHKDETALAWGVKEWAELVGILINLGQLIKLLLELKPAAKRTKLRLATSQGTMVLDLGRDLSAAELEQMLAPICPAK